jgi:hypothetical protein
LGSARSRSQRSDGEHDDGHIELATDHVTAVPIIRVERGCLMIALIVPSEVC